MCARSIRRQSDRADFKKRLAYHLARLCEDACDPDPPSLERPALVRERAEEIEAIR